jgi:hypothetical protein
LQQDYALTLLARQHATAQALQQAGWKKSLAKYSRTLKILHTELTRAEAEAELNAPVLVDPRMTHMGMAIASTGAGGFVVSLYVGRPQGDEGGGTG